MIAYLEKHDATVDLPDDIGQKDITDINENFHSYVDQGPATPRQPQPIYGSPSETPAPEPPQKWQPNFYESVVKPMLPMPGMPPLVPVPETEEGQSAMRAFTGKVAEEATFGAAKPILEPLMAEDIKDHPGFAAAGQIAGGVGSLLVTGGALRAAGIGAKAAMAGKAAVEAGFAAGERFIPRAIMSGATFGTRTFIAETVKAFQDGGLDLEKFGKDVLKDTAFGAMFGTIGGLSNAAASVSSAGALGFISSKMDGADNREASLNGAIWAAFETVGSFGRTAELRLDALKNLKESIGEYAVKRDPGIPSEAAQRAASQFVDQTMRKAGFETAEDLAKSGPENLLEGIEKVNQMVRNAQIPYPGPAEAPLRPELTAPEEARPITSQYLVTFAKEHPAASETDLAQMAHNRGLIEEPNPDLLKMEMQKAEKQADLPVIEPGSKTGEAHALFAYNDKMGPGATERSLYNVFGDPADPAIKESGWGSSVTKADLDNLGIPVTGREPRSVGKWEPLDVLAKPGTEHAEAVGPQASQGPQPTGPNLQGQAGKQPLSEESVRSVFPGPSDPSLKSMTENPDYINMRQKAAEIVHRFAGERNVEPTLEYAKQLFKELHDAVNDVRLAKPDERAEVRKRIDAKYPNLGEEFMTLKDQLYTDISDPMWFEKFVKGKNKYEPVGPAKAGPTVHAQIAGAGRFPGISIPREPTIARQPTRVIPEEVSSRLKESVDELTNIVNPAKAAPLAAQITRENLGKMARSYDMAEASLSAAKALFDGQSKEANLKFIDAMERGQPQDDPQFDQISKTLRKLLDDKRKEIQALGTGKMEHFIENYFPHIWDQGEKQVSQAVMMGAKRPFEGSKGFLKKRSIEFTKDGIEMGLTPVSYNPVDLALLKIREMDKYLAAHRTIQEYKASGLAKYVKIGGEVPEGWQKIDDRISTVFKSPMIAVKEAYDEHLMNTLNEVGKSLGIDLERKMKVRAEGAEYKNLLGVSVSKEPGTAGKIETRFASPESTLAHELGHQLDNIYGLKAKFLSDEKINQELGELAKERHVGKEAPAKFKKYVQQPAEKMAVLLESYIHAPDLLKEKAPTAYEKLVEFLKNPDPINGPTDILKPLAELKPSLVKGESTGQVYAGGSVIAGHIYAQPDAARIINNYLSPGLQKSAIYQAFRYAGNAINQFQLGFSAFHLGFTSVDSAVSKFALALNELAAGHPIKSVKDALQTPFAPVQNIIRGDNLLKAWRGQGKSAIDNLLAEVMASAGGRARMDQFYATTAYEQMKHHFEAGNVIRGLLHIPLAVADLASKPILEWIVPRQKLGIFADIMKMETENHPEMSHEQMRAIAQKAWDSVDNRMGQLVYDNLFWNRTFKDLLMASVRSVGWNLGTIRELAGGATDYAEALANAVRGKKSEFSYRMAYFTALPIVVGTLGAIIQYLRTGKGPQELKDYWFPRSGGVDSHGDPTRIALPSYMKDLYHYTQAPVKTVTNKLSPVLSMIGQMLENKDYFGTKIRNEDDPLVKQVASEAAFMLKQVTPFSIRNMQRNLETENKTLFDTVGPWVGITPAPYDINQTKAEKLAHEIAASHQSIGGRTEEQANRSRLISDLTRQYRRGDPDVLENLTKAYEGGLISRQQMRNVVIHAGMTPLQRMAHGFSLEETERIYRAANQEEKAQIERILQRKLLNQKRAFLQTGEGN